VNNNESTILFVYEVDSASILRSHTVTGQSTIFPFRRWLALHGGLHAL